MYAFFKQNTKKLMYIFSLKFNLQRVHIYDIYLV